MNTFITKNHNSILYRAISLIIAVAFFSTAIIPPSYAQSIAVLNLPTPGTMVLQSPAFVPVLLKGMTIHPEDPFRFDFIVDSGNTDFTQDEIKKESEKLVKYFLASMTIPKDDLWVNLSPYESDRIIPEELGKTDLGRDMLAQDYILKQLTASLMYPEDDLGSEFWKRVYKKAEEQFGTSEIPVNTFNKVWIMPESATVYENDKTIYVVESRLKVLLEEDYLALQNNEKNTEIGTNQLSETQIKNSSSISSQIVREIILPEIEKEVNQGRNFAPLRQIYNSLILAKWYKETIKNSLLSKVYIDQKKTSGVELDDQTIKEQIYDQYMKAYKKGVFDFIKEDYDQLSQEVIPRRYFSGGEKFKEIPLKKTAEADNFDAAMVGDNFQLSMRIAPQKEGSDQAMMVTPLPKDAQSISGYQELAEGNTKRTILDKENLTKENIAGALRKFWNNERDASGNFRAKYFPGNTIVFTFDDDWQKKLGEYQDIFKERQKAEGLDNMTAFVDKNTFHLTFTDMVNLDDLVNFIPGFAKAQAELEDELTKRGVPKNALNRWIGKFYKKSQNEPGQFSVDAVSVKEFIDSGDAEKFEREREILSKIYDETIQVLRETEKKINDAAIEVLNEIQGLIQTGEIRVKFTGLGSFSDFLILAMFEPSDEPSLQKINEIRARIYRKVGLLVDPPFAFMLHASLGYHVNKVEEETDFAKYKNIVKSVSEEMEKDGFFNKDVIINNLELRHFGTMYDFEARSDGIIHRIEIEDQDNAMLEEEGVLDIIDHRSNRVSLVGGKAASLKELGSIPGINVPAGFNVTTKIYENYLKEIGAESYIKQLEDISEEWKALEENNPKREKLRGKMLRLAIKIHDLIIGGEIPSIARRLILASYRKLEKSGQPALVAVRSSATAEDMPDASFAGQYTTYLNIQGEDQLIKAIKGVWASTYYDAEKGNMNPVEYRNKHNLKHSKNKMCALILEMVNPQSAGTAFSVDLETGAPFISVNNSYGLGEAEVAGLVTSDTWIVDPNTGEIIKRRLGEKGIKIVYDSDKKLNVKIPTSEIDRNRFAISRNKAKEIALLVKKIQDHYIQMNPDLNYMDIEYVVTNDDQITFTQARPETVWTKGTKSLIAINAQEINALNKKAKKSGKQTPYPEIFKGGVSGSPGVARGILRVVATVKEAEEKVKPGDIMVAPNTTNAWEPVMGRASGIITEIGGPGNHTAVVSREQSKAAIVAAIGAMQTLRIHEGQMVTVDATSKKVYLNEVPQEYEFMPDKIAPQYGSLFSQTLDESWNEAQETMTTTQDPDGTRWINKPNQKVRKFLQEVLTRSHHYVAEKILGIKITDRISVDEENPKVGIYQVDFDTIYPWMTELARKPLNGPDSLSSIHEARVENIRDFLQKSENLTLTKESISAWLDSFIEVNAYMSFAYNIYRITEGLLEDALKRKQLPEPYLSQVWQSMAVWVGETEAIKRNRDYGELLEELKDDDRLREDLENAVTTDAGFNKFAIEHPEFFSKFDAHVFNYKIMNNTDDIFSGVPFHGLLAKELLKDAADNRTIAIYDTKPEQFYPEDPEFTRIARLAFFASKLRQDAHHFKVRGQWKFVEVLHPLAKFLIEKGDINVFDDIFDHTPEWIIEKVAEYEKAGLPAVPEKTLFHIKPYEIQNLEVDEGMQNKDAMLTSMGRWQFDSVHWDANSGRLTLVNAKRIEGIVKPEFLENGQHTPRDIILSARKMNDRENSAVETLATSMGMDISKIFVINLDQAAAFNRIYGLYSNGNFFIREDVLSEGNQDQIHEALDHLRLKPTGLGYEELKKIQYYGNLRGLITNLSHKTIKTKLLFKLYGEQEALKILNSRGLDSVKKAIINAILHQLGDKQGEYREQLDRFQTDELFYDKVSREMIRNDIGFIEALRIVNKMNADSVDSAMASSPGGIDMNNINVNRQGSGVDIQFDPAMMQDILNNGVDGFVPVIIDLTPINSIMPLLGLEPRNREEKYEVSALN